ncbi:MAG: hypothetical protein HY704_02585 [Gemmatimonadetes bacterium]|nr:hypothetical protein [Gemmatimonadota bacterium]
MVPPDSNLAKFDHLVVLMLENRSFDNLLGYLYEADRPQQFIGRGDPVFRGVTDRTDLWNEDEHTPPRRVSVHRAPYESPEDMCQPFPDPGEEYLPHVNCQLYGADDVREPGTLPEPAPMSGFLRDYSRVVRQETQRTGVNLDPARIMQCYPPEAVPVLSTLARKFAVSDEWFSSVPTQTFANRSFLHSGQSNGWVHNRP